MFCPDCGAEYRPEFTCCAECGARLVVTLPSPVDALPAEERPDPDSKTVAVFRTSDAMLLPIVKSLVEAAGGDLRLEDSEAGAQFSLELPMA
jgi:predicted amidophosphoribosyltransferase